jgi:hypothetical protein
MRGAIPLLPQYVFMACCLVKQRDNFTCKNILEDLYSKVRGSNLGVGHRLFSIRISVQFRDLSYEDHVLQLITFLAVDTSSLNNRMAIQHLPSPRSKGNVHTHNRILNS